MAYGGEVWTCNPNLIPNLKADLIKPRIETYEDFLDEMILNHDHNSEARAG